MDLATTLERNYVFRGLPKPFLRVLAAYASEREHRGGDVLVRQFDRSQDLVIILEGQAVTRNFQGEVVASFGPGSTIGEMALIDGEPRCATVVAIGKGKTATLSAECLRGLAEADPRVEGTIMRNIAKVVCRRLRTMNERSGIERAA